MAQDLLTPKYKTVYANNITFLRWIISNGDDSISMKQNSTNIYIANCTFYNGLSFAMGSIGQYPGQINVIENVTAENIILYNTIYGGRIKTVRKSRPLVSLADWLVMQWTGVNTGYPPNGGGRSLYHVPKI
jgi:galacturan 1,4-alpha-galacturonidase